MELRVLKYFLTVAREGNITKAAEVLHITQPTLSRQLMELEEELGTILFYRGKRNITLTEAGMLFQKRAEEITGLVRKTEEEFETQKKFMGGVINIGCVESLTSKLLIDVIEDFSKEYPNLRYDLYNGFADDIKYKIDKGLIDIGLLLEPVEVYKYDFIKLPYDDNWGVLVPTNSPLASKESVTMREIVDYPLLLPYRAITRKYILNWFGNADVKVVATYNLLSNLIFMVEKGFGYAICLDSALVVRNNNNVKFIPFEPRMTTKSVIVWRKNHGMSDVASLFLEKIKNAFKAL